MKARHDADLERGRGGKPYIDEMLALREQARAALAGVVHVDPANVALTTSTTEGCNIVLAGLELGPDDEVVTTDSEHFGLLGPMQASRANVRVGRIRDRPPEDALEAIMAEVTPKTKLLALSHVSWLTGNLLPIEELQEATGLPVLVDGAQSGGAIPVEASRYDFYTLSGQKWLCGPESTGGLYIKDPEALRVARPTYFSQLEHDEAGRVHTAGRARNASTGAGSRRRRSPVSSPRSSSFRTGRFTTQPRSPPAASRCSPSASRS